MSARAFPLQPTFARPSAPLTRHPNAAVFSPQYSSPTKIKGTYTLLCKRLGKAQAAELLMKNPGVLCNSPSALSGFTDGQILDSANLVASLDANKPLINAAAGVALALVLAAASYRTVSVNPSGTTFGSDEVAAIKAKKSAARERRSVAAPRAPAPVRGVAVDDR